ncbi:MAG TPA: hypothetical protein VJ772_06025 [Nitrososphaeraceae archaeon]|nr:hypothetical protein [Nitrososphaeraceae archaeon]
MTRVTNSKNNHDLNSVESNGLTKSIEESRIKSIYTDICLIKDLLSILRKDFDLPEDKKNGN